MLWLILNSCDVLQVQRSPWHISRPLSVNQCHLSPFNSCPSSSTLTLPLLFIPLQKLASYRLFSWLDRSWLHWCCFHSAVGWKTNEANNPENSISSLKCTTRTQKHIACSKNTPCSQNYSFWGDEVYLCSLSSLLLSHLLHFTWERKSTTKQLHNISYNALVYAYEIKCFQYIPQGWRDV